VDFDLYTPFFTGLILLWRIDAREHWFAGVGVVIVRVTTWLAGVRATFIALLSRRGVYGGESLTRRGFSSGRGRRGTFARSGSVFALKSRGAFLL
jgi:hypothetical protein